MKKMFFLCSSIILSTIIIAQLPPVRTIETPMESPKAMVMQRIGITNIIIEYSRPAVKGRKIWGTIVPYDGKPYLWRAGANENTSISFDREIFLDNKLVLPGKYGLHMLPGKDQWLIILSKNNEAWGSFFYKENEDVLRLTATPSASNMQEWLTYEFENLTDSSAIVNLKWEQLKIPFKITVPTKDHMVAYIRKALTTPLAFTWNGLHSAADYFNRQNYNLEEALQIIQRSIRSDENYVNSKTKSEILAKMGKENEAAIAWSRALEIGGLNELNRAASIFLSQKNYEKAKEVLLVQEKRFADNAVVLYNLGRLNKSLSKLEEAKTYFVKAQNITKDEALKIAIKKELE